MKQQRNTIYIDAANLIMGAQKYLNGKFNIFELLVYLKDRYRADECIYFTGRISKLELDYQKLENLGVEIIFKEIYREGDKVKANCDVQISNRITEDVLLKKVDNIILISGDGDFVQLLDYAKEKISSVILISVSKFNTSRLIRNRRYLKVTYLTDIIDSIKGKGPAGHVASEGRLFINSSIATLKNLSSEHRQKVTVCGLAYKMESGVRRIFLAKRAETKKFLPGKFELVGGHVELTDKSLEEALQREVKEELGEEIIVENLAGEFLYFNETQNSQSVEIIYWIKFLDEKQIKINLVDHSEFVWVSEQELDVLIVDKNDAEYVAIKKALTGI